MGLIPFKKNLLTRCVDPIKFYEYYATGLPVLTTDFGEMSLRKKMLGVYFLDDINRIDLVANMSTRYEPDRDQIVKWRDENTWQKRFRRAGIFRAYL